MAWVRNQLVSSHWNASVLCYHASSNTVKMLSAAEKENPSGNGLTIRTFITSSSLCNTKSINRIVPSLGNFKAQWCSQGPRCFSTYHPYHFNSTPQLGKIASAAPDITCSYGKIQRSGERISVFKNKHNLSGSPLPSPSGGSFKPRWPGLCHMCTHLSRGKESTCIC